MVGVDQVDLGHVKTGRIDGGPRSAIVVGAGIIGLSTAWFLQEHGIEVTVVDRIGVAAGASWGNAGWIAPSLVALDEPATLRQGLSSLLRPTGSLHDVAISDPGL
jgi:D-amino-acid dehydrogenase